MSTGRASGSKPFNESANVADGRLAGCADEEHLTIDLPLGRQ
jgi:hypothetical protein